jgi:hypothetical protein
MENESKLKFTEQGLIIEKDRVLTYSKLVCPLECKYCFVEALKNDQQQRVAYLSEEQMALLNQLPQEVRTIMLGCDTEFNNLVSILGIDKQKSIASSYSDILLAKI